MLEIACWLLKTFVQDAFANDSSRRGRKEIEKRKKGEGKIYKTERNSRWVKMTLFIRAPR